ncbi:camp phosphodiesterase class-ii [Diplodia corticola]|uniref:Camp phosphodiesterase class-ii n=1 Tax=Diplodia corticola TaxID=236234 RepID=A0A1J9RTA9_9PEZI|nr:camp phosphodiesterase class-ii [Diplodia corticola]OJD30765.1 camp phosphodiesterase class-ii [Diplodia corticola]
MKKDDGFADQPPKDAAIQVICLGAGGGPNEDSVTGLLVRATASKWSRNSILAIDAGTHLASITRILEQHFPSVVQNTPTSSRVRFEDNETSPSPTNTSSQQESSDAGSEISWRSASPQPTITTLSSGAFAGLPFPHASARANAVHVVREHVATYLITHPHLDHLSGFVINTAAFHNTSKPKRLAALPFTVNSIKTHIFNDVIWPNLTDEDGGVGFVTFQRLAEGGHHALGDGPGRGYIEVCDGLGVKGFKVSHGNCMKGPGHIHRGSSVQISEIGPNGLPLPPHGPGVADGRSLSVSQPSAPGTPMFTGASGTSVPPLDMGMQQCVVDSSAYFIRTELGTHYSSSSRPPPAREILIFGDVEPDMLSLSPRTAHVWAEAAPKIANGTLKAVFIECSYADTQGDAVLFGHLAPRHLIKELETLADMVRDAKNKLEIEREEHRKGRKRKRTSTSSTNGFLSGTDDDYYIRRRSRSRQHSRTSAVAATSAPTSAATSINEYAPGSSSRTNSIALLSPGERIMRDYMDTPTPSGSPTPTPGPETPVANGASHAMQQQQTLLQQQAPPSLSVTSYAAAPAVLDPQAADGEQQQQQQQQLQQAQRQQREHAPLKGLQVVVIHVKDTLMDGPPVGDRILVELENHERNLADAGKPLGCEFVISHHGGSYWF